MRREEGKKERKKEWKAEGMNEWMNGYTLWRSYIYGDGFLGYDQLIDTLFEMFYGLIVVVITERHQRPQYTAAISYIVIGIWIDNVGY